MYRWFGTQEPDEVRTMRPETTPPRPNRWTGRILLTVGVLALLVLLVSLLPMLSPRTVDVGPPCDANDRAVWDAIDHYRRLEPIGIEGVDGCSADVPTRDPADEILDYYERTLVEAGWTILERNDPDPAATPPVEPSVDRAGNIVDLLVVGSLQAAKDEYTITVVYDYVWVSRGGLSPTPGWRRTASFSVDVAPELPEDR